PDRRSMGEGYDERRMANSARGANHLANGAATVARHHRGEKTMRDTNRSRRAVAGLLTVAGMLALLGMLAIPSGAAGVTREKLEAQGWTCVDVLPANRWSCFNPGTGRPFPGNPDPRPSYT